MSEGPTRMEAEALLFHEAACLDRGQWDEWLTLYAADARFWVPAWRDELTLTEDPDRELSLIYYQGKSGLEDRVARVKSGQSVASHPRPRCVHAICNVVIESATDEAAEVTSNFIVNLYDVRASRSHTFFGHYRHSLRRVGEDWLIAGKTIHLLNDTIPTVVDFYSL